MVTFLREPNNDFGIEQQPSGVHTSASEDINDLEWDVRACNLVITVSIINTTQNGVASNVIAFEA